MATESFWFLFLLLLSLITKSFSSGSAFGIVEPFPENIYPLEFTKADVTCVAFDAKGILVPEKIKFMRRNDLNRFTELKPNDNLRFTNRNEQQDGKTKIFATMYINNVTLDDDSLLGPLGRYECHAFAVGDTDDQAKRHGFSVSVIRRSEIPKVVVPDSEVLQHHDNVTLICNLTDRGDQASTPLKRISWFKDNVLLESVRNPDPQNSKDTLGPLTIKDVGVRDGGNYTCLLEVLLRNFREYSVSDYTVIRIAPWFEHKGEKEVVGKTGETATLECSARGFPLNVEWKSKSGVISCNDTSTDKRYSITRMGKYDPYSMIIADLETTDSGSYYCCLPSNCSTQIDEDRCQKFVLTVNDAPWFEYKGEKEVVGKAGETATMECSARGFPLNVEWKSKSGVISCNDSPTDKRYNITRKGKYDHYSMIIADLETTDSGSYYCCLPSNCSTQIDEDRCQKFVLTVNGSFYIENPKDGAMALTSHGIFVMMAFFMVSSLIL